MEQTGKGYNIEKPTHGPASSILNTLLEKFILISFKSV